MRLNNVLFLFFTWICLFQSILSDECNKTERKQPYCSEGKIQREIVSYETINGTCISNYKIESTTPECKKKNDEPGRCENYRNGTYYGQALDKVYSVEINDQCQCVHSFVLQPRTCGCPNPTTYTRCDTCNGIEEKVTTEFQMIDDDNGNSCKPIETRKTRTINYIRESTIIGPCNTNGYRTNVITNRYLDETCRVQETQRTDTRLCACPSKPRIVQECNGDSIVTDTYVSELECCSCTCICKEKLSLRKTTAIECPRPTTIQTACSHSNAHRMVTRINYRLENCKCTEAKDTTYESCIPCKYLVYNQTVGPCCNCKNTRTITIVYRDTDCQEKTKTTEEVCSCQEAPAPQTECQDGTWETTTTRIDFDQKTKTCVTKVSKHSKPVTCPSTSIKFERCGVPKKFKKMKTTLLYEVDLRSCQCKQKKEEVFEICESPPTEYTKWECQQNDHRVRKIISYVIDAGRNEFERKVDIVDMMVKCTEKKKDEIVRLNDCATITYQYFVDVVNCECKYTNSTKKIVSCCPRPPKPSWKCVNENILETTQITYRISLDKTECLPQEFKSRQRIVCKNYQDISTTPCKDGRYEIIKKYFAVKNCNCVQVKIERIPVAIKCNTSKPEITRECKGDTWVITTKKWTIVDCLCTSHSTSARKSISCPESRSTYSKCDRKKGVVTVTKTSYIINKCKCRQKKSTHNVPCKCFKPDKIEKSACFGDTRIVSKYRYELVDKSCVWVVLETESEDCKCREDSTVTSCQDKYTKLSTTTFYRLERQDRKLSVLRCVPRVVTKFTPVVCGMNYTYIAPCINFKQTVVSCRFDVTNCECIETCNTDCVRACNCEEKNECKSRCFNNNYQRICYQYSENGAGCGCNTDSSMPDNSVSECARSETVENVPVSCLPPNPRRTCTKCSIYRDNGFYKQCTYLNRRKHKCQCRLEKKEVEVLCRCRGPETKSVCRNNNVVVITTIYEKKKGKCVKKISKAMNPALVVPNPYFITKDGVFSIKYILVNFIIENCQIVKKRKTKHNFKCLKRRIIFKKCSGTYLTFTKHSWKPRYTNEKLFSEVSDSPMLMDCFHKIKIWTKLILCEKESLISWCNVKTKRVQTTRTCFRVKDCICVKTNINTYKDCVKCPPTKIVRGKCGKSNRNGYAYREVMKTRYELTKHNVCKNHVDRHQEICRCPRSTKTKVCQNGKSVLTHTEYVLRSSPPCKIKTTKTIIAIVCYKNPKYNKWRKVSESKCRHPHQYSTEVFRREVFRNCSCVKETKTVKVAKCCGPCKSHKKCINNRNVLIKTCERPIGLRCKVYTTMEFSIVSCRKPIKKLIGKPSRCVQKFILIKFASKNCRCEAENRRQLSELTCCIPKSKEYRVCVGNRWKITTTTFQLRHGRCNAQQDVTYDDVSTTPLNDVTIRDSDIDKNTFERAYFKKRIVHCKYQEYFIGKEILKRSCPARKIIRTCKNDRTVVTIYKYFRLSLFRCYPRTSRKHREIDCSHLILQKRVSTGKCKVKDIYYKSVHKDCKCHREIVREDRSKRLCCYYKRPFTRTTCNDRTGVIVTTSYTYHLINERCIRVGRSRSVKVNCNRRVCHNDVAPCKDNTNVVRLFCQRRNKCRCVTKLVRQGHQCCKPLSYEWKVVGRCSRSTCYRSIQYYAFRLEAERKLCKPVVIRVQKRRCCCAKGRRIVGRCVNDIYKKVTVTTYRLNEERDTCVRQSHESITYLTGCSRDKREVRVVSNRCDRRSGWARITTEYVQATNCKCVKSRQVKRCPCVCRVAFPTTVRKYCRNNRSVTETRRAMCNGCRVRWIVQDHSIGIVNCERYEIENGNCFSKRDGYAIRIQYVSKIQYRAINCKCVRKEVRRWKTHCQCRRSRISRHCLTSKILIIFRQYTKKRGICRLTVKRRFVKVPCPSRSVVRKSRCRNNRYQIITQKYYRRACKCFSRVFRLKCDCRCPSKTVRKLCTGRYFVKVITTTWRLNHCRCTKREKIQWSVPKCPHYIKVSTGHCVKRGNEGYRRIIFRRLAKRSDICKCVVRVHHKRRLCWCKAKPKTVSFCRNNNILVTETSKRILREGINQCLRIIVRIKTEMIKKNRNVVSYQYNGETGEYEKTTVSYDIVNCVSKATVTKETGYYKCPKQWKRIKKGTCNRRNNCQRIDIYSRKQLKDRMCVKVQQRRTVKCCCQKTQRKTYCKNNKLHTKVTKFTLHHNACIYRNIIAIKPIRCLVAIIFRTGSCNNRGYKVVREYKYVNRNCKCVKQKIREFRCRCKCGQLRVKYHCDRYARVHTKIVTKYVVDRCRCRAIKDVMMVGIRCPRTSVSISRCSPISGRDFSIRITRTKSYSINNKCKCVPRTNVDRKICQCRRKEKRTTHCDKIRHLITLTSSYTVLRNNACVRRRRQRRRIVNCGSERWILRGESGCVVDNDFGRRLLTYVRQRAVGCQCKEETRVKTCNCVCHGVSRRSRCNRMGNQLVHTHYKYKMIGCKCVVTKRVVMERITCLRLSPLIQRCRLYRDGVYRKYTIHRDRRVHNCRCQIVQRPTWVICKCPQESTVQTCDSYRNVLVFTHTWYQLFPRACIRQTRITYKPVPCDTTPDCSEVRKCIGRRKDRQTHRCIFRTLTNCQCKQKVVLVTRRCMGCKRKRIERGSCNSKICSIIITTTKYYTVVLRNNKTKCTPKRTYKKEICCCRKKPKTTVKCINNRLMKTTVSYDFKRTTKVCHKTVQVINITPQCFPHRSINESKCSRITGCRRRISITRKSLVNCRCNVTKRVIFKMCCCKKSYTIRTCSGGIRFIDTTHRFNLNNGRCISQTIVRRVSVNCPKERSYYKEPCNRTRRTRVKVTVSYKLINCKCYKFIKRKFEICACPPSTSTEVCNGNKSVFVNTKISYLLDRRRHRCIRSVKVTYRWPRCNMTPIRLCTRCKVSYTYGTYIRCTTTRGTLIGCSCVYQSKINFELCKSPRPVTYRTCVNDNIEITRVTYYERKKCQNRIYNFELIKKSKIIKRRRIRCPNPIIRKGACIRGVRCYYKTSFKPVNCICSMKVNTYKVLCSCNRAKVISKTCVRNRLTVIVRRHSKLFCDSRHVIPRCKCVQWNFKQIIPLECRGRHHTVTKCRGELREIRSIKYEPHNCKCSRIVRTIQVHCKECKSEMPHCAKIKAMGLCKSQIYRRYLCQFSCGYCERCPKKCATKHISPCQCKTIAGIKICARKTRFSDFRIVHRKCKEHKSVKHSLCSCSLEYSRSKCEQLKKAGRCNERRVMRSCQFVCTPSCHLCRGKIVKRQCVQEGPHKGTFNVKTITFHRVCDSCVTELRTDYVGHCVVCDKMRMRTVTDCIHGTRYLLTRYVEKEGGRCVNKESRVAHSCRGCCKSTETKIGECSKGRRTVVTVFWAKVHHCCQKKTAVNVYSCNRRCLSVKHVTSMCSHNWQLYVQEWRFGSDCRVKCAVEIRKCVPVPT